MPCIFCEIIAGKLPAHVVFEDETSVGFLDTRPLFRGHVLLVPRQHVETLLDLPAEAVSPLFQNTQRVTAAVEQATGAQGSFVAINNRISQSVPHLHVHIVPRRKGDGLKGFFWPRRPYESDAEMAETARAIREALAGDS